MRKLARSALLGAVVTGLIAGAAQAHTSRAYMSMEFFGTGASNDPITVPCEATDYLTQIDYNLDPSVTSPMGNNTGAFIKYIPMDWLTSGTTLTFQLNNAKFSNNLTNCWLVYYESVGLDNDGNGSGDIPYDINGDHDTYDMILVAKNINDVQQSPYITFRVLGENLRVPEKAVLYLMCAEGDEQPLVESNKSSGPGETPADYTDYAPVIRISTDLYENNETYGCVAPGIESGKKVCIKVTDARQCCLDMGIPALQTPEGEEYCFIDTACQFSLNMRPSLSIINMYNTTLNNPSCENSLAGDVIKCYNDAKEPGTEFVEENNPDDILTSCSVTDKRAADGTIVINNDADDVVDDDIVLGQNGWTGKFEVSIYDIDRKYACDDANGHGMPKGAYKALDFANDRMFIDNNGNDTTDSTNDIPLAPGVACTAKADIENGDPEDGTTNKIYIERDSLWKDDVYMGVNGNRLYWVRWGMEDILRIYKDGEPIYTVKTDEKAANTDVCLEQLGIEKCCYDGDQKPFFKKWEPNGDEAYVPYMLNSNKFRIIVSNNSCWDADIYARVWDEKGRVADNVYLGTIGANSVKILYGDKIFAKARGENPELGAKVSPLYSVILTVGAPKRDVEFAAYDNRETKTKMIPVYDLSGEETTYRNIELGEDPFEN